MISKNTKRPRWVVAPGAAAIFLLSTLLPATSHATSLPDTALVPAEEITDVVEHVSNNPESYTGVYFDSTTGSYVVGIPQGRDRRAALASLTAGVNQRSTGGVQVVVREQRHTLARLKSVVSDLTNFKPSGRQVYEWYLDERTNTVKVGVDVASEDVQRQLQDRYGDTVELFVGLRVEPAVKVSVVKAEDIRWPTAGGVTPQSGPNSTRLMDDAPYSTGKRIFSAIDNGDGTFRVMQCTDAFRNYPGTRVYTAGHCFTEGTLVWQGHIDANNTLQVRGRIGRVAGVQWGHQRIDAEAIDIVGTSTIGPSQFTGGNTLTTYTGRASFGTGNRVCSNGSFTTMTCVAQVVSVNTCWRTGDGWDVCGQDRIESLDGRRLVQSGDSGGPVINDGLGAGARVGGIISAGNIANGGAGNILYSTRVTAACAQLPPYTCD